MHTSVSRDTPWQIPRELSEARFTVRDVSGIGRDPVTVYQDPSNIMQIGDRYYVWYTRYPHDESWMTTWRTSNCTKIWLATSADGVSWLEHGQVLEDSDQAAWHGEGKHAPAVVYHDGKYYLYFCAHTGKPVNEKYIGVALADSPEGPFKHVDRGPVLSPTLDGFSFDAHLIDDPCVIVRDGRFWMYYKGRTSMRSPCMIGLAVAENPTGPFARWKGSPLLCGHTGCVWPHREGVALIADEKPPDRAVYYSPDGYRFEKAVDIVAHISDPGVFSADAFDNASYGSGVAWGLSQLYDENKQLTNQLGRPRFSSYVVRWDCDMRAPADRR